MNGARCNCRGSELLNGAVQPHGRNCPVREYVRDWRNHCRTGYEPIREALQAERAQYGQLPEGITLSTYEMRAIQ